MLKVISYHPRLTMATDHHTEVVESPEVHFEPLVQLPTVEVITMEEEEEELIQLRAKLFRFDSADEPAQWKERGTGTVKLLKHKNSNLVRVLMRRDKTHKICANHYVQPEMELKPNCGSEKAWVWTTQADFSDGEAKAELLAIRFANAENAQKWKSKFSEAQEVMKDAIPKYNKNIGKKEPVENGTEAENDLNKVGDGDKKSEEVVSADSSAKDTENVTEQLESLTVKENESEKKTDEGTDESNKTDSAEADDKKTVES